MDMLMAVFLLAMWNCLLMAAIWGLWGRVSKLEKR